MKRMKKVKMKVRDPVNHNYVFFVPERAVNLLKWLMRRAACVDSIMHNLQFFVIVPQENYCNGHSLRAVNIART